MAAAALAMALTVTLAAVGVALVVTPAAVALEAVWVHYEWTRCGLQRGIVWT